MITAQLLVLMFAAAAAPAATVVTNCGADPSGKMDSSKAFADCLASVPLGDLTVPIGTYKISGTIIMNRNQSLKGSGSKASILDCQATAAPCLVIADRSAGINNYNNALLQDLTLQGPGMANSSIGLYLGGDPKGMISAKNAYADGASLNNVRVTGFNRGIVWGNNAWGNKIVQSLIFQNATGLYVPPGLNNSGENTALRDTNVFNNKEFGIDDHTNFEWMLAGTSFDYNGTAIQFLGATLHIINSHFEQSGGQVITEPYGSGALSIRDTTILVQSTSGSDKYVLGLWPQNLHITIDDVSVWSNHPIQFFMRVQGNMTGSVGGLHGNGNKMIHAFSDPPGAAEAIKNTAPF